MKKICLYSAVALTLTLTGCIVAPPRQQVIVPPPVQTGPPLGIEDVKSLAKAGLSDDLIVSQIRSSATVYHLGTADIIALKTAGIGEKVIDFMINTPMGAMPPPSPTPVAAAAPTGTMSPASPTTVAVEPPPVLAATPTYAGSPPTVAVVGVQPSPVVETVVVAPDPAYVVAPGLCWPGYWGWYGGYGGYYGGRGGYYGGRGGYYGGRGGYYGRGGYRGGRRGR